MIEFANVSDLDTLILAGPTVLLVIFALALGWKNRIPTRVRAFELAPAFGL